ncbi:MAG: GntR family transcriptional regulator [Coriobacteriaceae bacterium]|nr:GntR family transcriptional regulator [Coriobacteriaceae bacterium]
MDIIISNSSSKPIYEQITVQIKEQIMSGGLKAGEQLPSIRALANSLRVSAITTKRAYSDLETQGFIETVQGKGSFVAGGNDELLREERLREVEANLLRAIEGARTLGVTDPELVEMLEILMESDD